MAGATGAGEKDRAVMRMDRRAAAWPDFLRRMLLGASLASTATMTAAAPDETPPGEIAEADAPAGPVMPVITRA